MQDAITARFSLVCDEVRREDNGKLIIIGLYTPDISVPQLPFVFPSLTLFQAMEASRTGQFPFRSTLQLLETGAQLAQAIGTIEVSQPGPVINILRFGFLKVQQSGVYTFSTRFEDTTEGPMTHSFQVILRT